MIMNSGLELEDFNYREADAKVLKLALIHEGLDVEINATATTEITEWKMKVFDPETKERILIDEDELTTEANERLEQEFWESLNTEPDEE